MSAKDIRIKLIDSRSANKICKKYHYSGKVVPNSQLHFGVYYNGVCEGVLQFGPSTDKRRMAKNLKVGMGEFLELNRMALSDRLPRFSESRAISVCVKILKKKYPFLKLIISFSDACQCGDGAIYRASGFKLLDVKKNNSLVTLSPSAMKIVKSKIPGASNPIAIKSLNNYRMNDGRFLSAHAREAGISALTGFQLKYIYCIDPSIEGKYKFIPFDEIPEEVKMYKGVKRGEHESNAH